MATKQIELTVAAKYLQLKKSNKIFTIIKVDSIGLYTANNGSYIFDLFPPDGQNYLILNHKDIISYNGGSVPSFEALAAAIKAVVIA